MGDTASIATLDWFAAISGLLGGLALFLFGLDNLSKALRAVAGDGLRLLLGRLTGNRWIGVLTGGLVTGIIQSSSVTTVLVVGFVSGGVMTLAQAIPVIYGANIGSTVTAQIIAFDIGALALPMFAIGFGMSFLGTRDQVRGLGSLLMGLGLVFFGMTLMGDTMRPLRDYPPFIEFLADLSNPLVGVLAAAVFTAIIQSSAATLAIAILLAGQGLIDLEGGIAVAFGANIGTCATAALASIGRPREAVRAALVHILFNIIGVLLWLPLIGELAWMVAQISPQHLELEGVARLAAQTPREIANAHTIFNIINTLIFLPFVGRMASLADRLAPDRPRVLPKAAQPVFLEDTLISTPALALDVVRMELDHLGSLVDRMLSQVLPAAITGGEAALKHIAAMDDDVDDLHGAILEYMRRIGSGPLSEVQMQRYMRLLEMANALETIGDVIETDLVQIGLRRIEASVTVSAPTQALILDLHARARDAVLLAIQAAVNEDRAAAERVIAMKKGITALAHQAAEHGAHRLLAKEPNRLRVVTREMEVIERLRRIYYYAKRIAHLVLEEDKPDTMDEAPPVVLPSVAAAAPVAEDASAADETVPPAEPPKEA